MILARPLRKSSCWRRAILQRIPPKVQRRQCKAPSKAMQTAVATTAKTFQALALAAAVADNLRRNIAMTSSKKHHRTREIRTPMTGGRGLRAQLLPVRRSKPKEPFPPARKHRLLLVRQTAVASRPRGEPPRHPARRRLSVVDMLSMVAPRYSYDTTA